MPEFLAFAFIAITVFFILGTMALVGFLIVWLVPTYLLSRVWRGGLRRGSY